MFALNVINGAPILTLGLLSPWRHLAWLLDSNGRCTLLREFTLHVVLLCLVSMKFRLFYICVHAKTFRYLSTLVYVQK